MPWLICSNDQPLGEVMQCQRERISAGETEAEKSSFPKDRSPCAWEREERNHFTWGLGKGMLASAWMQK